MCSTKVHLERLMSEKKKKQMNERVTLYCNCIKAAAKVNVFKKIEIFLLFDCVISIKWLLILTDDTSMDTMNGTSYLNTYISFIIRTVTPIVKIPVLIINKIMAIVWNICKENPNELWLFETKTTGYCINWIYLTK